MLKFELEILSGIKKEYETYIEKNKDIYDSTKIYFRYIKYRNRLAIKEIEYKRIVEDYNYNENTYPHKLVNHKFRDVANKYAEKGMNIEEDIMYINEKIKSIKCDINIYNLIDSYIKQLPQLLSRIEEIKNKLDAIEKGFVVL